MVAKYGLLMLVAVVSGATALAPCVCTRNLRPVCGSDGKTYANQCILDCEIYNGKQITKERDGSCEPPQRVCSCTFDYTPVCGSDGQTYPNQCALECDQSTKPELRTAYPGECKKEPAAQRVCICTMDYRPVCGSDGQTYPNQCALECDQSTKPELRTAHPGECKKEPVCTCGRDSKFVCGTDGTTYPNMCLLECSQSVNPGLRLAHEGACVEAVQVVDNNPMASLARSA